MALSDLELLQLVEKAQQKNTGPQGEPGIGIASIEQFTEDSFTISLSNGASKKIALPKANDGAAGEVGPKGEKGDRGSDGRNGRQGDQGPKGSAGVSGADGVSVTTAVVNADGVLLLGLSDNSIIRAGSVIGPAGASGPAGRVGDAGRDGLDGAAVLSGPRAPQETDGANGDHWIDISSAEYGFYKKSGNGWQKLSNLRQPTPDRLVGSPGGGGGGVNKGGGTLQTSATLPLANPSRKRTAKNLPDTEGLKTQSDFNQWTYDALESVSDGIPPVNPDLVTQEELQAEANKRDTGDKANLGLIRENKDDIDDIEGRLVVVENDYTTTDDFNAVSEQARKNKQDIQALQNAPTPVTRIIAGNNVTLDPEGGTGNVKINVDVPEAGEPPNLDAYATKADLSTATAALPYTIETDKTLRQADLKHPEDFDIETRYTGGEIYLTDNLGYYSNVRFSGQGNISTRSDSQGIIIDGSGLMPRDLLSLPELN